MTKFVPFLPPMWLNRATFRPPSGTFAIKPLPDGNIGSNGPVATGQKEKKTGNFYDNIGQMILTILNSSFGGAFFAFIFGLITYRITKKKERLSKHKNAVVEIEYLLNEHLNSISRNQFLANGSLLIIKRKHNTYNRFYPLRLPLDIELKLFDLDLINQFATYRDNVDRINRDLESWNRANELLREVVLSGKANKVEIDKNIEHIHNQLIVILKFLNSLNQNTKRFLAFVRVYMSVNANIYTKTVWFLMRMNNHKINKEDVDEELILLEEEIAETKQISKTEIDEALSTN